MSLVRQARCNTYPSELVPSVWGSVKPLIERALKRGSNYTIEQIHAGLLEKAMQLFVWESDKIHAALVTTIQNRDEQRWCLLLAIGGERMDEWIHLLPNVEARHRDHQSYEHGTLGSYAASRRLRVRDLHS